ncbi:hypothetical protein CLU79DRAFT_831332 [Phycomyces nitens]|nr:hypothetical protein CLU79DRAFT_831332 [Phycomyces nitens]
MASSSYQAASGSGSSSAPWESLMDPQELQIYADLFRKVDVENKSILLKDEAMSFFRKSDVPNNILTEIWEAADGDNKGFLTDKEFCIALKLIACAQHGTLTASPILSTSVALPQFDGVTLKPLPKINRPTPSLPQSSTSVPSGSNGSTDQLTPEDRNKYISMFQANNPVDGVLGGDSVKNILIRSKLSPETLHAIWNLADTRKSGTLNQTEFIIAMHYVSQMMKKSIQSLPATLPVNIYTAASGRFGPSRQFSAVSPVMRQMSVQNPHNPPTRQMTGPSAVFTGDQSHHPTRGDLDVSPEELAKYSVFFENLNTNGTGYVSGK